MGADGHQLEATSVRSAVESRATAVEMRAIRKRFGDVVAVDGVDFDLREGEIHALLGENGAGKTTLMNILYGLVRPDEGTIALRGRPVDIESPQDAIELGIGMVHQHFMLVPTLTVAENIVLGERGPLRIRRRDLASVGRHVSDLGERYGLEVHPSAPVWQLSVGEQQRVEILRALHREARILVLDEPTASLAPTEIAPFLQKLKMIAADGASIVLISHHLDEVMGCADRVTVLRRGAKVSTLRPADTSQDELARLMVGRDVALLPAFTHADAAAASEVVAPVASIGADHPVLRCAGLTVSGDRGAVAVDGVDFTVGKGEIVAITGVEGNGQAELEEALFGLRPPSAGRVSLGGEDITGLSPGELLSRGVALAPSDRYRRGLVRDLPIATNLVLDRFGRPPFGNPIALHRGEISRYGAETMETFSIAASGPEQRAGTLSGGNAQKIVLARALTADPRLLICSQPTRGLDVGAVEYAWRTLAERSRAGLAILLISLDVSEVMALAHRCYVMYRGRLVRELRRDEIDAEVLGLAMGGAS